MKSMWLFIAAFLMTSALCFGQEERIPWKRGIAQIKGKVKSIEEIPDSNYKETFSSRREVGRKYFFNEKGLCTSWTRHLYNGEAVMITFDYSSSGKCTRQTYYNIKENQQKEAWHTIYKYDMKDSLEEQAVSHQPFYESIIRYNDKGDPIEDIFHSRKLKKKDYRGLSVITPAYESKFNNHYSNGLLIEADEIRKDTLYAKKIYQYDEAGRLVHQLMKEPDGTIRTQENLKYDSTGHTFEWMTSSASQPLRIIYGTQYDPDNKPIKTTWYNADGSVRSPVVFEYKYDSQGNWIEETSRIETKIESIKRRTIEYY